MKYELPSPSALLPTVHGLFRIATISTAHHQAALVLVAEEDKRDLVPLVRIHSECFTGDTLGSQRCDCHTQLQQALARIGQEGGLVIYLRQEGRGIGLENKIRAYALQDRGLDTVEANEALHMPIDSRSYEEAAEILRTLGVTQIRLLTNNPKKIEDLTQFGIRVIERIPLETTPNQHNRKYLQTKKKKLGHLLTLPDDELG